MSFVAFSSQNVKFHAACNVQRLCSIINVFCFKEPPICLLWCSLKAIFSCFVPHHTLLHVSCILLVSKITIKITKLGREIIEISIISPVQAHKLLILQGIYRNFDIFPQKCMLKTSRYSNFGHHCPIVKIVPIFTKFKYFSVGVCNTGGKNTKGNNVKTF